MTEAASPSDRRAQHVAVFGFILQVVLCGSLIGLAYWSESDTVAVIVMSSPFFR